MSTPSVCAILLTADRPEYTRQAVDCFRRQTYANKRLLVVDSSEFGNDELEMEWLTYFRANQYTIGELRNKACERSESEIIVHWDSDDYSHPNRIAEQVALLQSSGANCVGYNKMLFWRESVICGAGPACPHDKPGEAWLYSNANPHYALGTSLAYKREVWERKPFEATSHGEDEKFIRGLKVVSVPSCPPYYGASGMDGTSVTMRQPRMIARIHSSNTSTAYSPRKMEAEARKPNPMWCRVTEWDSYCAETMR